MGEEVRAGFLEERVGQIRAWKGKIRAGATGLHVLGHGGLLFSPVPQSMRVLLHPPIHPSTHPPDIDLSRQDLRKPLAHQLELSRPRMG